MKVKEMGETLLIPLDCEMQEKSIKKIVYWALKKSSRVISVIQLKLKCHE